MANLSNINNKFIVTDGGHVSIGATTTTYPLTVESGGVGTVLRAGTSFVSIDSVGSAASPSLIFNGDSNTGIFRAAADTLAFSTAGSERMRIDSSGLIKFSKTATTATAVASINHASNDFLYINGGAAGASFGDDSQSTRVMCFDSDYIRFDSAAVERMRLTPDGNNTFLIIKAKPATYNSKSFITLYGTNSSTYGGSVIARSSISSETDGSAYGANLKFYTNDSSNVEQTRLQISSNGFGYFYNNFYLASAANQGNLFFGTADNQYNIFGGGTYGYMGYNTGGYHRFLTSGTERMRIDSSGNVGIGLNNPSDYNASLNNLVVGDLSGDNGITIVTNPLNVGSMLFADAASASDNTRGGMQYNHSVDSLYLRVNNTVPFYLNSDGKLTLGTGTVYVPTGGGVVEATIQHISNDRVSIVVNNPNSGTDAGAAIIFATYGQDWIIEGESIAAGRRFKFMIGNTILMHLISNGNMTIGGTLTENSDISLKENIKPLESQLEIVSKLNPVSYNKIGQEEKEIGFIAQEVEEFLPELVFEDDGLKSLSYSRMNAVLVKAIQELKADNDSLKARIETLENN
jgi:hypothetical protein